MENLAYIYLALNDEIDRGKGLSEDKLQHPYTIWAPPIVVEPDYDRAIASETSADFDQLDTDSIFQPYQGFFYL